MQVQTRSAFVLNTIAKDTCAIIKYPTGTVQEPQVVTFFLTRVLLRDKSWASVSATRVYLLSKQRLGSGCFLTFHFSRFYLAFYFVMFLEVRQPNNTRYNTK